MSPVKKIRPITFRQIDYNEATWALEIQGIANLPLETLTTIGSSEDDHNRILREYSTMFEDQYQHDYWDTFAEIFRWAFYIFIENRNYLNDEIYKAYINCLERVNKEPCKISKFDEKGILGEEYEWVFKGFVYEVNGFYTDDEVRLLILEDLAQERKYFEKLNTKFNETTTETAFARSRIPENVRIEVWRRDGGKCARCGSREKLEYDHIVPVSKGGSNTARNIELLCEKCNRSKSNNVV